MQVQMVHPLRIFDDGCRNLQNQQISIRIMKLRNSRGTALIHPATLAKIDEMLMEEAKVPAIRRTIKRLGLPECEPRQIYNRSYYFRNRLQTTLIFHTVQTR